MRVLVVDDEPLARRRLVRMLGRLAFVTAVDEAGDGEAALARAGDFDVLLLDIRMPGVDGLEVARRVEGRARVVFTTAYEEHALSAFDAAAVDYLVKPVAADRLERALARVLERAEATPVRIAARSRDGTHLFAPEEIERFRAEDKVTVFEHDGREHVIEQSLASLEAALPGFVRVHRGELVRADAVRSLGTDEEGTYVRLASGATARVSRRQLPELRRRLGLRLG